MWIADQLAAGAEVTAEERTVGSVTSAVFERTCSYLGLAVIKRPYNADATVVDVAGTPAVVTTLPFSAKAASSALQPDPNVIFVALLWDVSHPPATRCAVVGALARGIVEEIRASGASTWPRTGYRRSVRCGRAC
ncbi:MAG: hypothetical protein R2854_09365 [Caldilineaceae bacterium]